MNRSHLRNHLAGLWVAILAVLCGCSHTGPYAPKDTTKVNLESNSDFILLDEVSQRLVTCSGIQQRTLADGRLEVTVNVRNRQNRGVEPDLNCAFKDEYGYTIDETPSQTVHLAANETKTVRFTSMSSRGKRFTVKVSRCVLSH